MFVGLCRKSAPGKNPLFAPAFKCRKLADIALGICLDFLPVPVIPGMNHDELHIFPFAELGWIVLSLSRVKYLFGCLVGSSPIQETCCRGEPRYLTWLRRQRWHIPEGEGRYCPSASESARPCSLCIYVCKRLRVSSPPSYAP